MSVHDGRVSIEGLQTLIKESMASSPSVNPYEMVLDIIKMAHSNSSTLTEIDQPKLVTNSLPQNLLVALHSIDEISHLKVELQRSAKELLHVVPISLFADIIRTFHLGTYLTKDEALALIAKVKATHRLQQARWVAKQLNVELPVESMEGKSAQEQLDHFVKEGLHTEAKKLAGKDSALQAAIVHKVFRVHGGKLAATWLTSMSSLDYRDPQFEYLLLDRATGTLAWALKTDNEGVVINIVRRWPKLERLASHKCKKGGKVETALMRLSSGTLDNTQVEEEEEEVDEAFLALPPSVSVHLIDNVDQLRSACAVLRTKKAISFDCEWAPELLTFESSPVEVLQLASEDEVYIVDLALLHASGQEHHGTIKDELLSILLSPDIVKVGYGVSSDIKKLASSYRYLTDIQKSVRIVDLGVQKQVHGPDAKTLVVPTHRGGLAALTNEVLGKPLKKADTLSAWERRPLRKSQIKYAALDAWSVIKVYRIIVEGAAARSKGKESAGLVQVYV